VRPTHLTQLHAIGDNPPQQFSRISVTAGLSAVRLPTVRNFTRSCSVARDAAGAQINGRGFYRVLRTASTTVSTTITASLSASGGTILSSSLRRDLA
jgi:hypothetical protein